MKQYIPPRSSDFFIQQYKTKQTIACYDYVEALFRNKIIMFDDWFAF